MSRFTTSCEHLAKEGWRRAGNIGHGLLAWYSAADQDARQQRARKERHSLVILAIVTIFNWMRYLVPLMLVTVFALLVSAVWGVGVLVDRGLGRRST